MLQVSQEMEGKVAQEYVSRQWHFCCCPMLPGAHCLPERARLRRGLHFFFFFVPTFYLPRTLTHLPSVPRLLAVVALVSTKNPSSPRFAARFFVKEEEENDPAQLTEAFAAQASRTCTLLPSCTAFLTFAFLYRVARIRQHRLT